MNQPKTTMIKKLLVALALLPSLAFAQDKIVMSDGNVKEGTVISDGGQYIRFTDKNNQMVAVKKVYVKEIIYKDPSRQASASLRTNTSTGAFGKNILGYNFFGLVYKNVGFSYERILGNGSVSLKIPVSFALGEFGEYTSRGFLYQSGIDFNIFPLGQGYVRYFLGPSIRFGRLQDTQYDNYYYDINGNYVNNPESDESNFVAFMFNNGVMWQPTDNLCLFANAGIGLRGFESKTFNNGVSETFFLMEASVGYRF